MCQEFKLRSVASACMSIVHMHMQNDLARDSNAVFCVIFVMYVRIDVHMQYCIVLLTECECKVSKLSTQLHTNLSCHVKAGNAPHYMAFVWSIKDANERFAANGSQVNNKFNLHM